MKRFTLAAAVVLAALAVPALLSQTQIANNAAEIAGKIVMLADGGTARTVTNAFTFDRDPSAPFLVSSGSAKVTNLDADLLDGLTSDRFNTSYVTTTSTGSQNDFDPGINSSGGRTVIRANNASLLTVTGWSTCAIDGQQIVIQAINGQVDLAHQSGSSTAANRLINVATSAATSITTGGFATYTCDATSARWRLTAHDQGAWITPTFAAGNYTSSGTWTVAAGDVTTQMYRLSGKTLTVVWYITSTTVSGTPAALAIGNGAFGSFTSTKLVLTTALGSNAGGANEMIFVQIAASGGSSISMQQVDAGTWSNATDTTQVFGQIIFEVT